MRTLLASTAIALAFSAPALAADCMDDLRAMNERISQTKMNYRVSMDAKAARELRELRDAARILYENGEDDACAGVVDSMAELIEKQQDMVARTDEQMRDAEQWGEREADRLKQAQPVTRLSNSLSADDVIGTELRNPRNEDLGEITDVIIDPGNGKIAYALVAYGGFLGLAESEVAVPWERLSVTEDRDVFVLSMTEEQLKKAPEVDKDGWHVTDDEEWRKATERFYQEYGDGSAPPSGGQKG